MLVRGFFFGRVLRIRPIADQIDLQAHDIGTIGDLGPVDHRVNVLELLDDPIEK